MIAQSSYLGQIDLNIQPQTSHLFFYSYNEINEVSVLLYKKMEDKYFEDIENKFSNQNLENFFKEISDEVTSMDSSPMITIARLLTSKFFGLFTEENMNKITRENKKLNLNDFENFNKKTDFDHELPWYMIRNSQYFYNSVKFIEDNPIQYDCIPGKKVYFIELPWIDFESLNENLQKINYPYIFKYFNANDINEEYKNNSEIHDCSRNLMKSIDIPSHINKTKTMYLNDEINYYYFISCNPPCKSKEFDFEGFFLIFPLYMGLFRLNNEKWIYITAHKGESPDEDILKSDKCKAVIIPGSPCHIYENERYIVKMLEWLNYFAQNPSFNHIKYLGICFGHQLFNHANGGKVQCRAENKSVHYVEKLHLHEDFWELEFLKNSGILRHSSLNVFQIHLDEIVEIPNFMRKFSFSDSCHFEILVSQDERILTMQGHPEYLPEFYLFRNINIMLKAKNKESIEINYAKIYKEYMAMTKFKGDVNHELRNICNAFLRYRNNLA